MITPKRYWPDWLGFVVGAIPTLVAFAVGGLVFNDGMSIQAGSNVILWCVFFGFIGFILHMISVYRRLKYPKKVGHQETGNE